MSAAELETTEQPAEGQLVANPFTGEVVDLAADTATLAGILRQAKRFDEEKKDFVKAVQREVIARMDKDASWTMHFPGLDLVSQSPRRVEYNGEALKKVLEELVAEGLISLDAAKAAIKREVKYSAKKRGVDALKKVSDDVKARLRSAERRLPDESRYVSVRIKDDVVDATTAGGE